MPFLILAVPHPPFLSSFLFLFLLFAGRICTQVNATKLNPVVFAIQCNQFIFSFCVFASHPLPKKRDSFRNVAYKRKDDEGTLSFLLLGLVVVFNGLPLPLYVFFHLTVSLCKVLKLSTNERLSSFSTFKKLY